MIISIDFDGTIVEDHYPDIGKLMPGAKESVRRLHENGNLIIINTCRDGQLLLEAINFLLEHDIPFDRVNDNLPRNTREYESNSRKVFADIYIDDRNLGGFPGWKACMAVIEGKGVLEFLANTGKLNHPVTASVAASTAAPRCSNCGVEINDSNRAPSRDNVTFTTTLCKACEEAVSWHLPFLRNEQDDTCDECGNRLTDPYYLIHFHGAPDLKVCPACAKAFRDAGNEYDLVKNSMIDLGDNIFVDAANQKRGYFVKTNKGFRRMSDHSANAVIGTCYRCKEMRLMPAGFNLCSECLDLRKLPIKTWVDNADEQPAEKLKTLRSRPKSN